MTTTVRRALAAALCLAALAACTSDPRGGDRTVPPPRSGASPDARGTGAVTVTGALRRPDGLPAAGQAVLLSKEVKGRDLLGDLLVGSFTGGFALLSCFDTDGAVLTACSRTGFTSRTLADGRYALQLSDAEARSTLGSRRRLTLSAALASPEGTAGAQVAATSRVGAGVNRLPTMTFWTPAVSGAGSALVTWTALPGASAPRYDVAFDSPTGLHLLRQDVGIPLAVDPRLLEDSRGTATVRASTVGKDLSLSWTAPGTPYTGTAGPPPSRRRACTVTVEGLPPRPEAGCWLTDGSFGTAYGGSRPRSCRAEAPPFQEQVDCAPAVVTAVEVDLGRSLPVDLVVARGACRSCRLEGSVDHRAWSVLAEGLGGSPVHAGGVSARFVRVVADPGDTRPRTYAPVDGARPGGARLPAEAVSDLSQLTELSVWPGRPRAPGATGTADDVRHSPWPWLAVALVLLVVGGLGYVAGTRRR